MLCWPVLSGFPTWQVKPKGASVHFLFLHVDSRRPGVEGTAEDLPLTLQRVWENQGARMVRGAGPVT